MNSGDESGRERHRRRTREAIADTAMRLFLERGFDAVSVAEVAAAAGVAERTVYNYFPTKAALFFDEGDDLLAELLAAVRGRPLGTSALAAVAEFVDGLAEWAEHRRPVRPTPRFLRLIECSPPLQAHRREMFARYESALSGVLADETGVTRKSPAPFLAAVALVGVLRAAFEVTDAPDGDTVTNVALDLLARGLGDYAIKRAPIH